MTHPPRQMVLTRGRSTTDVASCISRAASVPPATRGVSVYAVQLLLRLGLRESTGWINGSGGQPHPPVRAVQLPSSHGGVKWCSGW